MFQKEVSAAVKNPTRFAASSLVLLFAGFCFPQAETTARKSSPKTNVAPHAERADQSTPRKGEY
jgi:hypothetical protein